MNLDTAVRGLSPFLMIVLPLALGFYLAQRFRMSWALFGVGAATFIGSQVAHIPFNIWVLSPLLARMGLGTDWQGAPLALAAIAFGLSAGVFEEVARYLVYRFWLKHARAWREALMFGAGHGGIEAVLLGVLALLTFFQLTALRDVDLTTVVPADQVEAARAQVAAYWAAPWYEVLLPAIERASTLCFQVSLAVIVLQVFARGNPIWLAAAIAWHAIVDATALFALPTWGPYVTEGLVAVGALVSLAFVWALRDTDATEPPPKAGLPPRLPGVRRARNRLQPTREKLDESRYTD